MGLLVPRAYSHIVQRCREERAFRKLGLPPPRVVPSYPPTMTTRRQDLDLIEDVVRRSTQGNVKHHEVSQALMALERLELDRYEKPQPATK